MLNCLLQLSQIATNIIKRVSSHLTQGILYPKLHLLQLAEIIHGLGGNPHKHATAHSELWQLSNQQMQGNQSPMLPTNAPCQSI